jgi:outer membrane receptor protein involved in Fe transport
LIATYKTVSTDPIYARQRGYADHMFDPTTLYPGSDLRSALVSLHQSITDSVELRLDAFRTNRQQDIYPWNTGLLPYYYRVTPNTTTSSVSPNIEVSLVGGWTLSVGGSWGRDEHVQHQSQVDIAAGALTTLIRECYCNDALSYEVSAEGPLFAMSGGDARLAVGTGGRRNEFVQSNYLTGTNVVQGDESSRFAYAEVSLPLIGPDSSIAGVRRLDLTAAVRGEDYDSFGSVTTPKLGLIYGPNNDFTLKASWGKSFKAPTLFQLHQAQTAELDPASFYGGDYGPDATVLSRWGGNPDLDAERATTWTVSSAFHPEALPGLEAELTWFDIDYTDRVVQPIANSAQTFSNPDYAAFIDFSPTAEEQANVIAAAGSFDNYAGADYDPDKVVAIIKTQYTNVARQKIKGFDLSGSYRFDIGPGRLTLRGSATWLDSTQQVFSTQDPFDLSGTLFNPPRISSRVGAVWNQGGFTASAFANYKSGVTNRSDEVKSASFTTLDTTLRYATGERGDGWSNLDFAFSLNNLFNKAPPLYTPASADAVANVPPYDQTNYSAIGRYLSLSISKHW